MEIRSGWSCWQLSSPSCPQSVCENKANIRDAEWGGGGQREREEREIDGVASVSPRVPKIGPVFYPSQFWLW